MFTLLPSLYFVAVHYFRRWNAPYYYEENTEEGKITFDTNNITENNITKTSNDIKSIELIEKIDNTLLQNNIESLITNDQQSTRSNLYEKNGYISKINNDEDDQSSKVPLRTKKPNRSSSLLNVDRRKAYTGDLTEDDIIYLMNETGFTREQILLWHSDFLVCKICITQIIRFRLFSYSISVIVQMEGFQNRNLLIFINNFIKKVKLRNFANMPFVCLIKMVLVILVCNYNLSIIMKDNIYLIRFC
jgi:hypothetical protein